MYCSSCGVAVTQGLTYCNYCGAKLNEAKGDDAVKSSEVKPEMLVAAMVFVFVLGLVAITLLMGMLKAVLNLEAGQILFVGLVSFLTMLSLEGVFIRLLFRRRRDTEKTLDDERLKSQTTRELDAAQARALPAPVASVTEHTTRAFETVYNERTSK